LQNLKVTNTLVPKKYGI